MKRDRLAVFKLLFMNLAAINSPRQQDFLKVFGVVEDFAKLLGKEIDQLKFFGDLIVKNGEMNPKLIQFVHGYYTKKATRDSQQNRLWKLIEAEMKLAQSSETVSVGLAILGKINVNKLPAVLQLIWAAMKRVRSGTMSPEERVKLPMTEVSGELFRILVTIWNDYELKDMASLLVGNKDAVFALIASSVRHRYRDAVRTCFYKLRKQFGFNRGVNGYTEANLPHKIRKCVNVFRERGMHGFSPYPELRVHADKYQRPGDGVLSPRKVKDYIKHFVYLASKLNLPEDADLADILRLESRPIEKDGKVIGTEYFNPITEPFAIAQRQIERPGWKEKNFDSAAYIQFIVVLCAISRYNGDFDLPAEFRKHVKTRTDKKTRKIRKRRKKQRFPREWVDAEILRLKPEFDRIIKRKTYVFNKRHLKICLFLPQLVVLRYLGYRQQCLRRCAIGKNIKFKKDGSVTFYYGENEIKNGVIIDQTFSPETCSEIPQLLLMLDVLTQYHQSFLPAVRALTPAHYEEHMGASFFATVSYDGIGLIKRTPSDPDSQSPRDVLSNNDGISSFKDWFSQTSYELMNFDDKSDFEHNFHPHLLRGHCCDWLRKDLEWTWEDVAKAMGDKEETLKKEYFEEDERGQSAEPFVRYNEKLRTLREQKERYANTVPVTTLNQVQMTLSIVSGHLTEERELRAKAETDAATYRKHYEFVLSITKLSDGEVKALMEKELVAA